MRIHNILLITLMFVSCSVFGQDTNATAFDKYQTIINRIQKDTAALNKQLAMRNVWIKRLKGLVDSTLRDSLTSLYAKIDSANAKRDAVNKPNNSNGNAPGNRTNQTTQPRESEEQQTGPKNTVSQPSDGHAAMIIMLGILISVAVVAICLLKKQRKKERKTEMKDEINPKEKPDSQPKTDIVIGQNHHTSKDKSGNTATETDEKRIISTDSKIETKPIERIETKTVIQSVPAVVYPELLTKNSIGGRARCYTLAPKVVGISYQGNSHIKSNTPCQDYHLFAKTNDVWNCAIVSDGAGSKKNSDQGSKFICEFFANALAKYFSNPAYSGGDIPVQDDWNKDVKQMLVDFQLELKEQKNCKNKEEFDSYGATLILLAYSPKGYVTAHVGDGRAGIAYESIDEEGRKTLVWESIMKPHKGEEANQTFFSTTSIFKQNPNLTLGGEPVPETRVSDKPINAFALMSDGCEEAAWITYKKVSMSEKPDDFVVKDVNKPRAKVLTDLLNTINPETTIDDLENFVTVYNEVMSREADDKTILAGIVR